MDAAREEVLRRLRAATSGAPVEIAARRPRPAAPNPGDVALFCRRVADYRAAVERVSDPAALEVRIAERCAAHGATRLGVPAGLPWRPSGLEVVVDRGELTAAELDTLDGSLTGCALAIAETGTIVLDGEGRCGRRALTLVPDLHLCVVAAADLVQTVPDAIDHLGEAAAEGRPLTFVSGPSATSDIELERVEGVHGPRRLELFVVESREPDR